jgi:hypothetical protein
MPRKESREVRQFRDYIRTVARALRDVVFAGEYRLHFHFDEEWDKRKGGADGADVKAEILVDTVYLQMTLSCYRYIFELWKNNKLEEIYETLVHEFCHVLTEPLFREFFRLLPAREEQYAYDIRERQTQRMCYALINFDEKKVPWKKKVISGRHKKN